jgi:hypothetical protein
MGLRASDRDTGSPTAMLGRPEPDFDLADLGRLSRSQLRDLWQREVGEKPPGSFGRELLALGVAYVRLTRSTLEFLTASDPRSTEIGY